MAILAVLSLAVSAIEKPRVFVLTDIENEPDDAMSMVRFMVYSNQFDIEGLAATTSIHQQKRVAPERIRQIVEAYGKVRDNLEMPEFNGIDFMRIIEKGPKVVFTTAYEKYALQGIKLEAVDYLLKPFNYDVFLIASHKAEKIIRLEKAERENKIEANNDFLFIKSEYKIRRISFNDIIYIEGLKNYIKVFLLYESKPVLSLNTFKSIESKLPESKFMRVHRSVIVNLERIEVIELIRIVFGKVFIPVSDQYKDKFQEYLNRNFL